MTHTRLTNAQLITEAKALRQRVVELETADVEIRQAQTALQVSETRYRRLFETAQDGILILDADTGCITDVNPFLIKMLGYSYADFLGKHLWEIGPVKDAAAAQSAFLELQSNGYIRYEDLPLESRDGHRMSVEFVSNVYGVDQQQVIQCNIRDITARKWHERELESIVQMAAALRAAWTRAEMLPIIVQQAYSMSQANAAALVTLNPITGDVNVLFGQGVAVDWASLRIAPDGGIADLVIRTRQPYVNNDVGHKLQIDQPNLPGEMRAIACVPLIAHNQTMGALAIGRSVAVTDEEVRLLAAASDIAATALQRAEALETFEQRVADRTHELAIANEILLELDRLKSKFVSDVSHELRTPVTSLSLYVDLLEYGKPEKREFYVVQLKQQMGRLRMLINDILDLGHLERDRREDSLTPVNVNSIVERVTAEHQVAAGAAGLRLISEVAEQPLMVLALPDQLSRVMTNLVTNAIKYTRSGTVRVKTDAIDGRICITVNDTGMGIPPEDIPHIFDRFYRGKQVAQLTIPGTGLGLAIVKEIIDAHGGAVEVESTLGVGSTFRVWLPTAATMTVG